MHSGHHHHHHIVPRQDVQPVHPPRQLGSAKIDLPTFIVVIVPIAIIVTIIGLAGNWAG